MTLDRKTLQNEARRVLSAAMRNFQPLSDFPHFAGAGEKVQLRHHFSEKDDDLYDLMDSEYPWGFVSSTLVTLNWEFGGMGDGLFRLDRLVVEGLPVCYLESSEGGPYLLASTDLAGADLDLLHVLFRRNGEDLGTGIFGSAATSISFGFHSTWEFKLSLIRSGLDHSNAWETLRDYHPEVWDEEYEDPSGFDSVDPEVRVELKDRYFEDTGESRARREAEGRAQLGRIERYIRGQIEAREAHLVDHDRVFDLDRTDEANRELMLRRYVAKVCVS